jgi:uncharacterized NAD-dependent epimerase/dehydratase family protein
MIVLQKPYLLYLGNSKTKFGAKIADALVTWTPENVKGYYSLPDCEIKYDTLDFLEPEQAFKNGIKSLVIAFANSGGFLTEHDINIAERALRSGLDVISGMHVKLEEYPKIKQACIDTNQNVYNLRFHNQKLQTDDAKKRSGKRILTVGTDCSVGKMFASIAINNELQKRLIKSKFAATGQTGIILSGEGIAVDAVIADFISGAAASLSPDSDHDQYFVVEGQGSLHHPSFAGVSLGLLHGSQPDYLVICHEPFRNTMRHTNYNIPSIEDTINLNMLHASRVNKNVAVKGIVLNLAGANSKEQKLEIIEEYENLYNLPVADIFNVSVEKIVDNILA